MGGLAANLVVGAAGVSAAALSPATAADLFRFWRWASLLLGGFNALPFLPMDGGVLAVAVFSRSGSFGLTWRRFRSASACFGVGAAACGVVFSPFFFLPAVTLFCLWVMTPRDLHLDFDGG